MIELLLNKTTPHSQLLLMAKADQFMRRRLYSEHKVKEGCISSFLVQQSPFAGNNVAYSETHYIPYRVYI